jgi:hypothetical protein
MRKHKSKSKRKHSRVGNKISILRHEGDRQDVAVAKALSMERAGRLGPHGEYRRVDKHSKRGKRRKSSRSGRNRR